MKKILSAVLACTATMAIAATAFAETAGATAGASDEGPVVIDVEIKVGKDGIKGAALNDLLLVDEDGLFYTWQDVEEAIFTSEDLFSVAFAADKEKAGTDWFVLGVDEVPTEDEGDEPSDEGGEADGEDDETPSPEGSVDAPALREDDDDAAYDYGFDLTEDLIALFDTSKSSGGEVAITPKGDDEIVVNATVIMKADAEGKADTPNTGIALAIAPAGLAVAFVTVAAVMSKKKRG